ncbi:polysaccharide lyase family 7 protein [Vibrio sp. 2-Bac 85]
MKHKLVSTALFSVFLVACGGGGSGGSTKTTSVSSGNNASYTGVPYDYPQYINALKMANLQQSEPSDGTKSDVVKAGQYQYYDNDYFYIDKKSGWLTFEMNGESNRSELRFIDNFKSDNSETYTLSAEILPINPTQSVIESNDGQEITLLQVHNKGKNGDTDDTVLSHPLLRIIWDGENRSDDSTGDSYKNAYWAIIKTNALECKNQDNPNYNANCPDSYNYYYLADYNANSPTKFGIEVGDSKLIINVDDYQKVDFDISYWSDFYSYFKAGVYNQYQNGNSIVQFKSLIYNNKLPIATLNPSLPPSDNFILNDWYLSVPIDDDNSGTADSIKEGELSDGYESSDYFYTGIDGGMVFKDYINGFKTSTNTSYTRTELREMLREENTDIDTQGVNKNNWVFSTAPNSEQAKAGAVDGILNATLAVNNVTTTGADYQVGRVVIGQIHANDDEPVRLYYRLLPGHSKGAIYFAHEPRTGDEVWVEMIGSRSDNASEPSNGIELNEKFFYQIKAVGNNLTVTIMREDKAEVTASINMTNSGYDQAGQYMYFKAGVYNQNNTGENDEFVQATFYYLDNQH